MNEGIIKISAELSPLVRYLYKMGVLAVNGHEQTVHLTRECFEETFPTFEVENYDEHTEYHVGYYAGIKFFALYYI
jgi:hypothetical protein